MKKNIRRLVINVYVKHMCSTHCAIIQSTITIGNILAIKQSIVDPHSFSSVINELIKIMSFGRGK